jgi:hypothetical protein
LRRRIQDDDAAWKPVDEERFVFVEVRFGKVDGKRRMLIVQCIPPGEAILWRGAEMF